MKPKTVKILYWAVTILFSLLMLMSGIVELMQTEQAKEGVIHLGYPVYLLTILGIAKILGAVAILQWKFTALREWAYAGFAIDFIGASASIAFVGDGIVLILSPLVFLAVMFVSYYLWKKTAAV